MNRNSDNGNPSTSAAAAAAEDPYYYDDGETYLIGNLSGDPETGGGANGGIHYGPLTLVPLLGWAQAFGRRCGAASFLPILTTLLLAADTVLAIFAGLDAVDRGTNSPWLQFSFSLAIAALYFALFVTAVVMYRWERVLRYRYHWVLVLGVATVVAWTNFGVWASWQTRFAMFVGGVSSTDGNAFTTWVAINALGVGGFLIRFTAIALGQGLRYTYDRAVELQALVLANTSGGQSIFSAVGSRVRRSTAATRGGGGGAGAPLRAWAALPTKGSVANRRHPHAGLYAETRWAAARQQQQQHKHRRSTTTHRQQ